MPPDITARRYQLQGDIAGIYLIIRRGVSALISNSAIADLGRLGVMADLLEFIVDVFSGDFGAVDLASTCFCGGRGGGYCYGLVVVINVRVSLTFGVVNLACTCLGLRGAGWQVQLN